jgi:hypothetical protein
MTITTQILVDNVTYGSASGNYDGSSQDWYSDILPAANYYGGQGSLQTITYRLQNFVGIIKIEATLNDLKDSAAWFDIPEATYGDGITPDTGTISVNIVGNFTWLRAQIIGFDGGTIQAITAVY